MRGVKLTEGTLTLSDRFGRPVNAGDAVLARGLIEEKDVPAIVNHPARPK
jgi:hypothetical protein